MTRTLTHRIGDDESKEHHSFRLTIDQDTDVVVLQIDGNNSSFDVNDWPEVFRLISEHEFGDELQNLVSNFPLRWNTTLTTAYFQIILAGVNVAQHIGLIGGTDEQQMMDTFRQFRGFLPNQGSLGRLTILPHNILDPQTTQALELGKNSKIGIVTFQANALPTSFAWAYLPYATPQGFPLGASQETEDNWQEILSYCNSLRRET